ncbi:hypothetical protein CC78DRAFT_614038 [Lojkania enalia]|uniref:Nucleoporin Nup159/Nup146 N-terminal domain-containing protein n=1 Tax=Lojkania enalia TaxID=147567 RepID=A0A9P4KGL4_9PLEO|nr:hypothetical protein CC78DRAFT_614038 [Didymosphaeria enalia]
MAFSLNSPGGAPSVSVAAEVPEIDTEMLGFASVGGDKKLKLLPSPWPKDNLPPSSASLLAVASKRGLLAAAGPDALVLASTHAVRKALDGEADDDDVVSDFCPNATIPLPQLRHITFSSNENFLVITAESGGGLAVYRVQHLLEGNTKPGAQISTGQIPVRTLVPNPNPESGDSFAAVLDSGRLVLADVANSKLNSVCEEGVSCVGWSVKGRALIAGLDEGTMVQYTAQGKQMAIVPRPPNVDDSYSVAAVHWLSNDKFFAIYGPKVSTTDDAMEEKLETIYQIIKTDKARSTFSFHKIPSELCWPSFGPQRRPPVQYSITRLRDWKPDLQDMLIITASNCVEVPVLTSSSAPIAPDQQVMNDLAMTFLQDNRRAQLPQTVNDDTGGDSVLIGQALDLSSKNKVSRPIPMDEEIDESPTPLPAFLALNHQGFLSAWWVVYDKSIREGTGYPGLMAASEAPSAPSAPAASPTPMAVPSTQPTSVFSKPIATFGAPSTPKFGSSSFPTGNATFVTSGFGASNKPAQLILRTPGSGGATTTFGKPSSPSFRSTSVGMHGGSGFGAAGALGNRQSPWGSTSQTSATQPQQNPFSTAASGSSGFAKFGTAASGTGSVFSSFGSVSGGQSPFSSLGQQKSALSGKANTSSAFKGVPAEPSFGSTVTVDSSLGGGSTLPSWATTPAQQGSSVFGQTGASSFISTKESDISDVGDGERRERDEATPTPQAPPQNKGLFGAPTGGLPKLVSSFKGDDSTKDDLPKPPDSSTGSLFDNDFASTLGGAASKLPATPIKKDEAELRLHDISITPTLLPESTTNRSSPSDTPAKEPTSRKEEPPVDKRAPEDAPLPPDPMIWKPPKTDDDIPLLAGSPPIKVEAPESSVPSSPLEDEGGDISVEEHDGDDEEEEPSPLDRQTRPMKVAGWGLQDSVNQSPQIRPAAPTPPIIKSGASSRSGNHSTSPSQPPSRTAFFGQPFKSTASSLFAQSATPQGFPKLQPPVNKAQDNLHSPSPVRSASTSAIGTRRQQVIPFGDTLLSSSITPASKVPTSQPEISDLYDNQDEQIRQLLAKAVEPSRTLESFNAHHDYTGSVTKSGIPAQIELLYRDINSMVDTVGLNSRSLSAFLKYHSNTAHKGDATLDDLEEVNDQGEEGPWYDKWSLAEIDYLKFLESELEQELDAGRVQVVVDKLSQLGRLLRENGRLLSKLNEIRCQIINRKDPEKVDALRRVSLPKELADQQKSLRDGYGRLLSLLGQAEEATMLLRSNLASYSVSKGKIVKVPSVDAVKKTINKLIAQTEKENNQILLLESRLQRLGLHSHNSRPTSSSSRNFGTLSRSIHFLHDGQSPFATPATNRNRMSLSELSRRVQTPEPEDTPTTRGYGLFYTTEGNMENSESGTNMYDLSESEVESLRVTARRRRDIAATLSGAVLKRGVNVINVG